MPVEGDYECYSDDWQRSNPDLVLNLPTQPPHYSEHQDHVLVDYTPGGDLLAIWTMALDTVDDMDVFFARSSDHGRSWTAPAHIHEPGPQAGHVSSFGFPVMSKSGRIYVYYNRSKGIGQNILNSVLRCRYSDDDGHTWMDGGVEFEYQRGKWDNPDPKVPTMGVVWQKPIRDAMDRHVVALTRTVAQQIKPATDTSHMGGLPQLERVPQPVPALRQHRRGPRPQGRQGHLAAGRRGHGLGAHDLRAAGLAGLHVLPGAGPGAAAGRTSVHRDAHRQRAALVHGLGRPRAYLARSADHALPGRRRGDAEPNRALTHVRPGGRALSGVPAESRRIRVRRAEVR